MLSVTSIINNQAVEIRMSGTGDVYSLHQYLQALSQETKRRFGPHSFELKEIAEILNLPDEYSGFVAAEKESGKIIAYSITKRGFLEHDRPRLEQYGLKLHPTNDATYAPSVADEWQSRGLGNQLYHYMVSGLTTQGVKRIILWGGVQCDNHKAVNYYRKLGFTVVGQFEYYGLNYDMIKEI